MRRRMLLIHNATAGWRGPRLLRRTINALQDRGAEVKVAVTGSIEALRAAVEHPRGFDGVIVAGGDGSVRALAPLLSPHDIPLGLIPLGTGNVLANEIGLPSDPAALASLLIDGPAIRLSGGEVNGTPFYLMVGIGFDGRVVAGLDARLKHCIGQLAYVPRTLDALMTKPVALSVMVDGARHTVDWIIVTRARRYGGRFVLTRAADVRHPGLLAVLVSAKSRLALAHKLAALALGRLERTDGVRIIPCHEVTVTAPEPVPAQADGDALGTTPVIIADRGPPLRLIVPETFAATHSSPSK